MALASLLPGSAAPPALACYGAAALGMGGAYTSLATGVLATYWNQAGLAFTPGQGEASATVTTPKDYSNYNSFVGVAIKPTERLGLGFGQTKLAYWANGETWNTFAAGYKVTDRLAVGGAFRTVNGVNAGDTDPMPYPNRGVDLSAQYHAGPLHLGLLVQDLGGPSATNPYWQNVRPSVSLETDQLTLGFDVYDAEQIKYTLRGEHSAVTHQVGLEYRPFGKDGPLALRGGFYQDYLTYGGGVKLRGGFADVVFLPEWEIVQVTAGVRF